MGTAQKVIRITVAAIILVTYSQFLMAEFLFGYISLSDAKEIGALGVFMYDLNIGYIQHGLILFATFSLIFMIWPLEVKQGRLRAAFVHT